MLAQNSYSHVYQLLSLGSCTIDCAMLCRQLIFCTRKIKWAKFNKHNTGNVFVEELQKVNFSNYFCCIDVAYTDFLNKLMKFINEIAPSKGIRIKTNMQEWFDRKIGELIHARENVFLSLRKSKLHIDEENYKKVKYQVQNLTRKKKRVL